MLLLFYAVLHIISRTLGEKEEVQRFLKDDNYKPPIFGSYSFDPIQQIFEPPDRPLGSNENKKQNVNYNEGTKMDDTRKTEKNSSSPLPPYRKYVTPGLPTYLPGTDPNKTAHLRYRPKIRTITFENLTLDNTV